MQVGDTFTFEGEEFSIKNIIVDTDDVRFPNGRVDASKFVGEGIFRKIQKGRPKAFKYETVAEILGESMPDRDIDIGIEVSKEVEINWDAIKDPEIVEGLLSTIDDDSTVDDWE